MSHCSVDFYVKELSPLVDGKIIKIVKDDSYGEEYYGLLVQKGNKKYTMWILADDEGNGPGSFEINEVG